MARFGDLKLRFAQATGCFAARHPEWWALAISALAWSHLLFPRSIIGCACLANAPASEWSGMQVWTRGLSSWFVMILGMMLPLMIIPVRAAAFGSLWYRRHWAVSTFLAGYLAIWMTAGVGYLLIQTFLLGARVTDSRWAIGAAFFAAAAWQVTPLKRRFSAACHRTTPLAPDGWRAHRDCLVFGVEHGIQCVGNCGFLMLAAMLSPWHQAMMVVATLLLLYDRYQAHPRDRVIPVTLCLVAMGHFMEIN
jgi:predicted metal-binding membrane protein